LRSLIDKQAYTLRLMQSSLWLRRWLRSWKTS
jgi:hypothetical protein